MTLKEYQECYEKTIRILSIVRHGLHTGIMNPYITKLLNNLEQVELVLLDLCTHIEPEESTGKDP